MSEPNAYSKKDESYFEGAREDFINELPVNLDAKILEIGCSNGNTGALALSEKNAEVILVWSYMRSQP